MLFSQEYQTFPFSLEEQEVYALMGVSPLVLTDRSVKNPKNAIVSVSLPGAVPNKPPFEQLEFKFEPTAPAQNAQELDYYPERSVVEPVFSVDIHPDLKVRGFPNLTI
jgi:ribonuclease E